MPPIHFRNCSHVLSDHTGVNLIREDVKGVKGVKDVANVDIGPALGDNKPSPWGRGALLLYVIPGLVYLDSTVNGFDGSLMASISVERVSE